MQAGIEGRTIIGVIIGKLQLALQIANHRVPLLRGTPATAQCHYGGAAICKGHRGACWYDCTKHAIVTAASNIAQGLSLCLQVQEW